MVNLPGILGTLVDLLVIVIGFGAIIFVHELGHFLAARWAGIRVLTFSVGMGPSLISYRRGIGVRRGSTAKEYAAWLERQSHGPASAEDVDRKRPAVSTTEYRIAAFPFGGFVRMLGQDDLDPGAVSAAPDSYQNRPVWKRMVVISAGVVANIVTAALLFVFVFMVGLKVEPPKVGAIAPGSPAAGAVATTPDGRELGLQTGDTVVSINGTHPRRFDAIIMETATAQRGRPVALTVSREGETAPLNFAITPEPSGFTGLLDLGFGPAQSLTIEPGRTDDERARIREFMERSGVAGVEPGATLIAVDYDTPVRGPDAITRAFDASGGEPVALTFENPGADRVVVTLTGTPEVQSSITPMRSGEDALHEHLLGLAGVMMVDPESTPEQAAQGLAPGDVFARIGAVDFPSIPRGIDEIRARTGRELDIEILRPGADGSTERIAMTVEVGGDGRVGFLPADTAGVSGMVSLPVQRVTERGGARALADLPASSIVTHAGATLTRVNDAPVATLLEARRALRDVTQAAFASGEGASVRVTMLAPIEGAEPTEREWALSVADIEQLHALGWDAPINIGIFAFERELMRAEGPVEAVHLGLIETRRVMLKTYLTFARLFEGSVKVEHLKGPVGIAHIGTRIASRGFVWVVFFLALISINLAVINFLPLPIVDGGQFLMLLYEQLRGRPVPIPVQNAVTLVGLVMIGSAFVLVTFNDVKSLLGL